MYDVIVVGAGPAGCTAARKCSEYGMKTLLVEKRHLPRDKVCSGMIMGSVAKSLIELEFGAVPRDVTADPHEINGYIFYVPNIGSEKLDNSTTVTWRRNLDHWMCQKAVSCGVELMQDTLVTGIEQCGGGHSVIMKTHRDQQAIDTRFIIGADGATSVVRHCLFPEMKIRYAQIYQEHYRQQLDLDMDYFHWFYPIELFPASFTASYKDSLLIIDTAGTIGQVQQVLTYAKEFLKKYRFNVDQKPVWRGGCLEPAMFRELINHTFKPAVGNALLVGDAGGLIMPVSGEGIGVGMTSALAAAEAIKQSLEIGKTAGELYLENIAAMISMFNDIYPLLRSMSDEAKRGGQQLPILLRDGYQSTLRKF